MQLNWRKRSLGIGRLLMGDYTNKLRIALTLLVSICLFAIPTSYAQVTALEQVLQAAQAGNVAGVVQIVKGYTTVGVQIIPAASWDGTANFESSVNGTNFLPVLCVNRVSGATATTYASTTTNASFACPVSGAKSFQVRTSGRTAGTVTVTAVVVTGPLANALGGGSGTVTSVATTSPITGGTIVGTGTIACATCVTSAAALTANAFVTGAGLQASQALALTGIVKGNGASAPTAVAAPAGVIVGDTDPQILTNKRVSPRTGTTTSAAQPTINTDNVSFYSLTAQTEAITSFTTNLTGTPTENQSLWIAITGTAARAITWGLSFENGACVLPVTTVSTNRLDVGLVWNTVTTKWRCMASG